MKPVSPVIPNENFKEIMIAENQDEYQTLPAINCGNGVILSRWEFDGIELEKLETEKMLYIFMLTFGYKPKAMILKVEKPQFPMTFDNNDEVLDAIPFDTENYLAKFTITDDQFSIIKESRSIYCFMQTENQPIMPYLIQVDTPIYPNSNALVLARYDESINETAKMLGLNPMTYVCEKCQHKIIGTEVTSEFVFNNPQVQIYCTNCHEEMGGKGFYLPSTIEEYNRIKDSM